MAALHSLRASQHARGGGGSGFPGSMSSPRHHANQPPSPSPRLADPLLVARQRLDEIAAQPPPPRLSQLATPVVATPGGYRGLRDLQRELESLKLSLSVYLGPGVSPSGPRARASS